MLTITLKTEEHFLCGTDEKSKAREIESSPPPTPLPIEQVSWNLNPGLDNFKIFWPGVVKKDCIWLPVPAVQLGCAHLGEDRR